jgi:hypothetical protein
MDAIVSDNHLAFFCLRVLYVAVEYLFNYKPNLLSRISYYSYRHYVAFRSVS